MESLEGEAGVACATGRLAGSAVFYKVVCRKRHSQHGMLFIGASCMAHGMPRQTENSLLEICTKV